MGGETMITLLRYGSLQHYKSRKAPWVKLMRVWLESKEYRNMSPQARAMLVDLWVMAIPSNGKIDKNVHEIAWILNEIEIETCLAIKEISQVRNASGKSHWIRWDVTQLDDILLAQCGQDASTMQAPLYHRASKPVSEPIRIQDTEKTNREKVNSPPIPTLDDASTALADKTEEKPEPTPPPEMTQKTFEPEEEYTGWLAPYAQPYERRMGKGSFNYGRASVPMKTLERIHGKAKVQLHWAYACETEKGEYLNPQSFQQKFAMYDPEKEPLSELTPEEHVQAG